MIKLELVCVLILLCFIACQLKFRHEPGVFLRRLSLLAVASWLGENTVIHAYRFYSYSPQWSLFIDQVPLLIVLIWPVVIYSAWHLASHMVSARPMWIALVGGAIVLSDASLIEPIAVQAGLWQWHEAGLFRVPLVGILGWAYFALCCLFILEHNANQQHGARWDMILLVIPVVFTHIALLVSWWGCCKWSGVVPAWPAVVMVWVVSVCLTLLAWRCQHRWQIPRLELWLRIPGAIFFFVLLVVYAGDEPALVAYALAFVPPYLMLTFRHTIKKAALP